MLVLGRIALQNLRQKVLIPVFLVDCHWLSAVKLSGLSDVQRTVLNRSGGLHRLITEPF